MSPTLPELVELEREGELKARLKLRLSKDLLYFAGHFPEVAILPAVAQIDWALHFAVELFGVAVAFRGMDRLKFRQVLLPEDEPELRLELAANRSELEFSYTTARGRHSSGHLLIA